MKYFIFILFILSAFSVSAQNRVGIGTITPPTGTLHIDGNKNTSSSTDGTETADDVVVNYDGTVGIGLINPSSSNKLVVGRPASPGDVKFGAHLETTGNTTASRLYTGNSLKYGTALSAPVKARLDIEAPSKGAGLRLDNGTGTLGNTNFIPVLKVDADDNAYWANLAEYAEVKSGTVRTYYDILRSQSLLEYDITNTPITITDGGLWLIYARVTVGTRSAVTNTDHGARGKMIYLHLNEIVSGTTTRVETVAVLPEQSGAHVGIMQIQFLYNAGTGSTNRELRLAVTSDHYQNGTNGSNTDGNDTDGTTPGRYGQENRKYQTYGQTAPGGSPSYWSGWSDPLFFAIKIDHQN